MISIKRRVYASTFILTVGLLSACSADKEPVNTPIEEPSVDAEAPEIPDVKTPADPQVDIDKDQSTPEKEVDVTQEEVLSAIKDELKGAKLEKVLPGQMPVPEGKHLTAVTSSESAEYQVIFYATDEPTPINNEALFDENTEKDQLAVLKVTDYKAEDGQAETEVAFEDYSKVGGEQVDLGHGITGYQDAGVGNLWTSWNEGRWALATHTSIEESEKGVDLARRAVEYLETNSLPIPEELGMIRLDATGDDHHAMWAKGSVLYKLSEVKSPEDLLEIAVTFR